MDTKQLADGEIAEEEKMEGEWIPVAPFSEQAGKLFETITWIDETFAGGWDFFSGAGMFWLKIDVCTPEFAKRLGMRERFPEGTEFYTADEGETDPSYLVAIKGYANEGIARFMEELMKRCHIIKRGGDGTNWDLMKWVAGEK